MSKLDDLKRKGFSSDVEVEVEYRHYNWNKNKLNAIITRNSTKIRDMLILGGPVIPFVNFNTWMLLYKGLSVQNTTMTELDMLFDEYCLFYEVANEDGKLHENYSRYSLQSIFDEEIKEFTAVDDISNIIDISSTISVGDIHNVNVFSKADIIKQKANLLLKN